MSYLYDHPCYAYSRVSTKIQQEGEHALDRQDAWLRDGGATGFKATMMYSEIGSARGRDDKDRRPEFRQVWDEAFRDDVPLMVTSASRLSRNLHHLKQLMKAKPVRIIILDEGGLVSQDELFRLVETAEENGRKIAAGASEYAHRRIEQGLPQGCAASTKKAGIASGKVRAQKAHDKRDELIRFFRSRPDLMSLPLKDIRDALNSASIKTASGNDWTYNSVSKLLPGILREIAEICVMEAEIDNEAFGRGERADSLDSKKHHCVRRVTEKTRKSSPSPRCRKHKIEGDASVPEKRSSESDGPGCQAPPRGFAARNRCGNCGSWNPTGRIALHDADSSNQVIHRLHAEHPASLAAEPPLSAGQPATVRSGTQTDGWMTRQTPGAVLQRALRVAQVGLWPPSGKRAVLGFYEPSCEPWSSRSCPPRGD